MKAVRSRATALITRARSGHGCSALSHSPICACMLMGTQRGPFLRPWPITCANSLSAASPRSSTGMRRSPRAAAPPRPGAWPRRYARGSTPDDETEATSHDGRAGTTRGNPSEDDPLAAVGALPGRPAVGDGEGGLLGSRHGLGLLPA